jgi:hypothetical protein
VPRLLARPEKGREDGNAREADNRGFTGSENRKADPQRIRMALNKQRGVPGRLLRCESFVGTKDFKGLRNKCFVADFESHIGNGHLRVIWKDKLHFFDRGRSVVEISNNTSTASVLCRMCSISGPDILKASLKVPTAEGRKSQMNIWRLKKSLPLI